jgi:large subunit ribosomal protein L18
MKRLVHQTKNERRMVRHTRVRSRVSGTAECPRLSVFRGLKQIRLQLIDDVARKTLCAVTTAEIKTKEKVEGKTNKVAQAYLAGKLLAKKAEEKGIKRAVFDRAGYRYHGRVAAAAEGAREGGIKI